MTTLSSSLKLFLNIAIVQTTASRRFDGRLGGLSLTEFIILFHLANAPHGKMRRVDLAEYTGLTASGVTRLLAPMEKIGLVKREADTQDARVSFVSIAAGGKRMLQESMENAEEMATRLLSLAKKDEIETASKLLLKLGGTVM